MFGIIALGGCASQRTLTITGTFDPDEVSFSKQKGDNTIHGQAFMRQRGGGVVTCAGSELFLTPSGSYSRERIKAFYGDISMPIIKRYRFGGFGSLLPDPPADYWATSRQTRCDASGNFTFANVPDGSYFITTIITWYADGGPYAFPEGGALMTPVKVSGGEEKKIVMSN